MWTLDAPRPASPGINHYSNDPTAPFGGVKSSGMGRELGPEGLDAYSIVKSISIVESIYLDAKYVSLP